MKVFLHFEDCLEEDLKMTIKLTLPKSWRSGPAQRLIDTFVEAYNKKHPESELDESKVHFEKKDGFQVPFDAPVESFMESGEDLFLKDGPSKDMEALGFKPAESQPQTTKKESSIKAAIAAADAKKEADEGPSKSAKKPGEAQEGSLLCRRFGCNKHFKPEENKPDSCRFHSKPPVFHETRKFWACCPEKIGWDWNSFQSIEGCCVGEHSAEKPGEQLFLGGTDVRKELEDQAGQGVPQRLDATKSPMENLSALRRALIAIGVDGKVFDEARNNIMSTHNQEDASKAWEHVAQEFAKSFSTLLQDLSNTTQQQ